MKIAVTPRTLEFLIRQGNGVLDIVAPEVFYQIMMFLQPKDLRVCMCVSKKWKVRRKCVCTCLSSALSHFVEDMNTRQRLSFSFLNFDTVFKNSTPEKVSKKLWN